MKVPTFLEQPVVDVNGNFTDAWRNIIMQLINQMQLTLSDEGLVMPSQKASDIAIIAAGTPAPLNGAMIYDSTNDLAKINIAGTFKTITTS